MGSRNINSLPYGTTFQPSAQDASLFAGGVVPSVEPNLPAAYAAQGLKFTGSSALPTDLLRPYRGFGDINYFDFSESSNYNSAQISLRRRLSHGLMVNVAYTISKVFGTGIDQTATNPFNTRAMSTGFSASTFRRTWC